MDEIINTNSLGFNDNIYHEGSISRLPDFDGFFRKRKKRSHGKRKNGNLKRKNKLVLTLSDLSITLKHSCRHMAPLHLVTLSISSLRNLDIEVNKCYDRAHRLYDATLLTRCYTQHALRPYIDSEVNHITCVLKARAKRVPSNRTQAHTLGIRYLSANFTSELLYQ